MPRPKLIAFDFFGTLAANEESEWFATLTAIGQEQSLDIPDTNAALIQLVEKAPLAIMSNADDRFLNGSIEFNGWTFDSVISSETAQAYKPDPRAFAALCAATGVAAADILYVGDSPYDDAHGAKLAGMQTVLINRDQRTPGRTPPPDATALLAPDHVINKLTELPALLDELAKIHRQS
jgi:putative hydrolase of the HAD superfamily